MLVAAVVQTVISGPVGGTPMPEIMMSGGAAVEGQGCLVFGGVEDVALGDGIVRWASRVGCGTSFLRRGR